MKIENEFAKILFDDLNTKIDNTISAYVYELGGLKAGRANAQILDKITVDYYGQETPLNQLGNISIPEARMLVISVWDKQALHAIEKAISAANIGINPSNDGKVIRLIFPELTEERRRDLIKQIKVMLENFKIQVRNLRRDIISELKSLEKESAVSEDELKMYEAHVDKLTKEATTKLDDLTKDKEKEVLSV